MLHWLEGVSDLESPYFLSLGPGGSSISSNSQSADVNAGNFPNPDLPTGALRDGLLVGKRGDGGWGGRGATCAEGGAAENAGGSGSGSASSATSIDRLCILFVNELEKN